MTRPLKAPAFYGTLLLLDLAVIGLIIGFASGWWIKKTDVVMAASVFKSSKSKQLSTKQGMPIHLSVPALNMNLPVKLGTYSPEEGWALDNKHTFYATPSVLPNNKEGTTLIYGHNTKAVFKNLNQLKPGMELLITTENGYLFTYEYSFVSEVQPSDVSVFNTTNAPNITLQTCSGPWDELRSMYVFSFKEVKKV